MVYCLAISMRHITYLYVSCSHALISLCSSRSRSESRAPTFLHVFMRLSICLFACASSVAAKILTDQLGEQSNQTKGCTSTIIVILLVMQLSNPSNTLELSSTLVKICQPTRTRHHQIPKSWKSDALWHLYGHEATQELVGYGNPGEPWGRGAGSWV